MSLILLWIMLFFAALILVFSALLLASRALTRQEKMMTTLTCSHWRYAPNCRLVPLVPLLSPDLSVHQGTHLASVRDHSFAHPPDLRVLDRQFYLLALQHETILVVERMGFN